MRTSRTSSTLDALEEGSRVFLDASIFVYHFTGSSLDCRLLLEDCERGRFQGVTSVLVIAEVTHRLMTIEALAKGLITPGNPARKLREKPEIVASLHLYQEQIERIFLMGISIVGLDLAIFERAFDFRQKYGLLTNDSILAATASREGIVNMASADHDFEGVDELRAFHPSDLF